MAFQLAAVARTWHPMGFRERPFPAATGSAPPPGALVAVSRRARAAWWQLRDIAYAIPGTVIVGLDGTTLRIREDGSADEIGA